MTKATITTLSYSAVLRMPVRFSGVCWTSHGTRVIASEIQVYVYYRTFVDMTELKNILIYDFRVCNVKSILAHLHITEKDLILYDLILNVQTEKKIFYDYMKSIEDFSLF